MGSYAAWKAGQADRATQRIQELEAEAEQLRASERHLESMVSHLHGERDGLRKALNDVLYLIEDSNGVPRGDNVVEIRDQVLAALDGGDRT